jgi:hypothetical protein
MLTANKLTMPALGHHLFDVPAAEAKVKLEPDTMTDDLCREPMTLVWIGDWWRNHAASMPHGRGAVHARRLI